MYFLATNLLLLFWTIFILFTSHPEVRLALQQGHAYNTSNSFIHINGIQLQKTLSQIHFTFAGLFLFDLSFRFAFCPMRIKFAKQLLNIIDLSSTVLFVILYTMSLVTKTAELQLVARIFESFRLLLFFRLTEVDWSAQQIGAAIKKSLPEIVSITCCALSYLTIMTVVVFYCEVDTNVGFSSLPNAFWWSAVAMTTVGYGDIYPATTLGQIFAGFLVVVAHIPIAFVVRVLSANLRLVNERMRRESKYMLEQEKRCLKEREHLRLKRIYEVQEEESNINWQQIT